MTKWEKPGIAFDIGTTTIVGSLVDLNSCKEKKTAFLPNPQMKWGRDVLSRIAATVNNPEMLKSMQEAVVNACNEIIKNLIDPQDVKFVVATGNSVMEHLFLGISPALLVKVPYKPAFKEAKQIRAGAIGLIVNPETYIYTFPLIGGFIGGDTVAGILSTEIHKRKGYSLLIDIGTNNETALGSEKAIFATSTAAGPAFEGGSIKYGLIAKHGAIQGIEIKNDKAILDVIGNVMPEGICGSGIIDSIAKLLNVGIIDKSGRIKNRDEVEGNIANRIDEHIGSPLQGNEFILYKDAKREITITQNDVREIQLAKGAIQAGIKLLLKKAQVTPFDIDRIFIAGAFGNNIKKESLAQIGILEKEWLDKVAFVGDAALDGAKLVLCSEEKQKEAEGVAMQTKHISLSGSQHFQKEFLKGMEFPKH
ncbi:MAG: ASKHA domain-containing protein [Deltaproteobacteria bacterium]|nr:ASKHA domain-containing protein [Deltaproteobacteria bacterium]